MADKSITDWERKKNVVLVDHDDLDRVVSEDDFNKMVAEEQTVGVNFADREAFLTDNGYELTRENLVNPDLSPRQKTDET